MCQDKRCNNIARCGCCVYCYCEQTCYKCWDAVKNYVVCGTRSYECNNTEVRNKYVCFPCKRIWKSSVSKYQARNAEDYNKHKSNDWYSIYDNKLNIEKYNPINEIPNIKKINNNEKYTINVTDQFINNIYKSIPHEFQYSNGIDKSEEYCVDFANKINDESRIINNTNPYIRTERRKLKEAEIKKYINVYECIGSKCAKCKKDGIHVGRNFRHCKTDKEWKELEQKHKDGKIDLFSDFYEYPREGKKEYYEKFENRSKQVEEQKKLNVEQYCIPIRPSAPNYMC